MPKQIKNKKRCFHVIYQKTTLKENTYLYIKHTYTIQHVTNNCYFKFGMFDNFWLVAWPAKKKKKKKREYN